MLQEIKEKKTDNLELEVKRTKTQLNTFKQVSLQFIKKYVYIIYISFLFGK